MATAGGDAVYDFNCEFCNDEGYNNEAVGFCVECDAFLCDICIIHHRRNRLSRHHVVQDKDTMPAISAGRVRKDISTKCMQHKGEIVRFYCKSHHVLICSLCTIQKHNKCTNVDIIIESQSIFDDIDYKGFIKQLNYLMDKSNEIIQNANDYSERTENDSTDVIMSFKLFKEEVKGVIDDLEMGLSVEVETNKSANKKKMEYIISTCKALYVDIGQLSTEFKELQSTNRVCQAFIRMKEAKAGVKKMERKLREAEEKNKVTNYKFVPNLRFKEYLQSPGAFGTLCVQDNSDTTDPQDCVKEKDHIEITPCRYITNAVKEIDFESTRKEFTCLITGSTLLSTNRLIVVDNRNQTVKLIDTDMGKVMSEMKVQGYPWDVTAISTDQVAVTVYNKKTIIVLDVTDTIGRIRSVRVNGRCRGICFSQNQLIVSFLNPHKLEIISLDGNVKRKIEHDSEGSSLFLAPYYVCASNDGETIYVSDYGANKVMSLTKEDNIKVSYLELEYPRDMCVDQRGNVYVCTQEDKTIHMLTAECKMIKNIIIQKDELEAKVNSVSHCRQTDRLYVCDDKIKAFELS